MRLMVSFAALLLSVALLQLSVGALAPLDALSGIQNGFTTTQIGLMGSAHFVGFFIGCWWSPRLMGSVGHSRAFAAFAAAGVIGAAAHPILVGPLYWSALRVLTGLAVAGCYTVVEAWLNSKATNETRARTFGVYRVVDLVASLLSQIMIGVLEPSSYVSFNIPAILYCASLIPLALTTTRQPDTPASPRLRPMKTFRLSPLGALGVMVSGVTMPAFRMVGPIYGQEMGLDTKQIGFFLASALFGGALAQYPVGHIADKVDRRKVLIAISGLAALVCFAIASGRSKRLEP